MKQELFIDYKLQDRLMMLGMDIDFIPFCQAYLKTQVLFWLRTKGINVFVEHGSKGTFDLVINKIGCIREGFKTYEECENEGVLTAIEYLENETTR